MQPRGSGSPPSSPPPHRPPFTKREHGSPTGRSPLPMPGPQRNSSHQACKWPSPTRPSHLHLPFPPDPHPNVLGSPCEVPQLPERVCRLFSHCRPMAEFSLLRMRAGQLLGAQCGAHRKSGARGSQARTGRHHTGLLFPAGPSWAAGPARRPRSLTATSPGSPHAGPPLSGPPIATAVSVWNESHSPTLLL